ncbi:MAG: glycoside hydrolase family 3 C-terminal domain-containing protein [Acidobacteriaceae bacterium]|nr:glycoside hydrolase family 3 C-terminal domain-containing protein [Acidobacteriaceae bacterium]
MQQRSIVLGLLAATLLATPLHAQSKNEKERADKLLKQMTLEEKIQQLHGPDTKVHDRWVPGIPRLGIPPLPMANGPAGIGPTDFVQPRATAYPAPLAIAASWDKQDAWLYGESVAREVLDIGRTMLESPTVNIARIPGSGRTFEGFGEDPFLTSEIAVANIRGVQSLHVLANVKHFALNNQEDNRLFVDAEADDRTMREIYFPAFEAAVKRAHVASFMCAYNKLNGRYACQNDDLLTKVLRHDWKFDGFVVSDFGAAHDAVQDIRAGLDLEMPKGDTFNQEFLKKVASGEVPVALVDQALRRRYETMMHFGLFNHPLPTVKPIDEAAGARAARKLATDGIVLLRNAGGILPLTTKNHSIAVIGPETDQLLEGGGAAFVLPLHTVTPIDALRERFGVEQVHYAPVGGTGFVDRQDTIDGLALSLPNNSSSNGVKAEYFANTTFSGTPKAVRTERIPEIRDEFGAPFADMLPQFSLRWTTTLQAPATGEYTIGFEMWGKMRLYLDDKLLLDDQKQTPNSLENRELRVHLEAGHPYALRAEYVSTARGLARLYWKLPAGVETPGVARAVEAARHADTAVVFVGEWAHEGYDAPTLALPALQNHLIEAVAAANPHTIVVLQTGTPVLMPWLNKVAGVLEAWFPGEEGGNAVADVLTGVVDPSSKLPITFPASDASVPANTADQYPGVHGVEHYTEKLEVGYRWQDAHQQTPLFPFGFGLSYTHFRYSSLRVKPLPGGRVDVSALVQNDGPRAGADVAQLYLSYPSSAGEPPRQLRDFAKVALRPGERKRVHLSMDARSFSIWSAERSAWTVTPGTYTVWVGNSSRDLPLHLAIQK